MECMINSAINYAMYGNPSMNSWNEQGYLLNQALDNMYSEGIVWNNGISPITIAGYGNTGRTTANNLNEQYAMLQVLYDPLNGAKDLSQTKNPVIMNDTTHGWLAKDGWVKMQNTMTLFNGTQVNIHFLYNTELKIFDDFKFVN